MKPIWHKVVRSTERMNPGHWKNRHVGGSRKLYLPCGHYELRKLSQVVPERVRCTACEGLRSGNVCSQDNGDGTMTVETWDTEKNEPKREIKPTTFNRCSYVLCDSK